MAWCNLYTPPIHTKLTEKDLYGPEPYDLNFCFPINLDALENDRLKLTPFIPRIHARKYFNTLTANPQLYRFINSQSPNSLEEYVEGIELNWRRNSGILIFAIIDKTRPSDDFGEGSYAGTIAFDNTSPINLVTELGFAVIFPPFQRTHVLSNAIGLLLHYSLNLPGDSPPGLGLRRVQWIANITNEKSIKAAERMGFRREATMRWNLALPERKEGKEVREEDPLPKNLGRDTALLSICWDDWISGTRDKAQAAMARSV